MLKTHKIALDPNHVMATQLAQHCGYAHVAYNITTVRAFSFNRDADSDVRYDSG